MLSRFLAIPALAGLAFATTRKDYLKACKKVEAAISSASDVYYPGEYE